MPLLKLRQVADELGLSSLQSVYNMAKRGAIKIVYLPISGAKRGAPRVNSADIESLKQRIARGDASEYEPPQAAAKRPASRRSPSKSRRPRPAVRQANLLHFE